MDARSSEPSMELHSRAELTPVFDDLNRYVATTHFNGQSTVTISGAAATGESYCLAHHVSVEGDERTIMIASIRYEDTFTKLDGTWLFSERRLYVDWTDTRPISS
jgi:SnoaL-like domain